MISKSYSKTGQSCRVTFRLSPEHQARSGAVLGEFNDWSPEPHRLERRKDGAMSATLTLPAGRDYRFRYLLDGERWVNDEQADALVVNPFGTEDSLLTLATQDEAPAVGRNGKGATPKKEAAAKESPKKEKAAPKKELQKSTQASPGRGRSRSSRPRASEPE